MWFNVQDYQIVYLCTYPLITILYVCWYVNKYIPVLYTCMYCELSHSKSISIQTLVPLQQVQCVNTQYMMYIQRTGDSALMVAARRGETEVVKELVEGGADLNLQNKVCQ